MVEVNWVAILLAALASMVIGAIWYGVFSKTWLKAMGKKKEDLKGSGLGYLWTALAAIVTADVLAHFIVFSRLYFPEMSDVSLGASTAFWAWLGFVFTYMIMTNVWEHKSWMLVWLSAGNQLLSLVAMGLILATM